MARLSRRLGAIAFVVSTVVAAMVIGLLLSPDLRQPAAAPGGDVTSGEVADDVLAGVDGEAILGSATDEVAPPAQAPATESSSARATRPELAPPPGASLSGAARPAPIAGVRSVDYGEAVIASGLDPNASSGMDTSLDEDEALLACAAADGGLDAACSVMGRDSGFVTLDDMFGVGNDETNLSLDALGASSMDDETFGTFDTEWVGENLTPFVEGDQLGIVPDAERGSNPTTQPDTLLGSIGGPQSPGALPPASGPISGDTGGAAPDGSVGSLPGGTGSASAVPDASRVGLGGVPRSDRPTWSSPPSRMALPVEVNAVGDPWNAGPSPAQTPELGSLALFGTGAASIAGYVLVRVRAGRGRRK